MTKFIVLVSMEDRSYTRIHRVIYGHSKDPGTETANTFCHSYFDTYYEARDFALSLRVKEVFECSVCSPRHY